MKYNKNPSSSTLVRYQVGYHTFIHCKCIKDLIEFRLFKSFCIDKLPRRNGKLDPNYAIRYGKLFVKCILQIVRIDLSFLHALWIFIQSNWIRGLINLLFFTFQNVFQPIRKWSYSRLNQKYLAVNRLYCSASTVIPRSQHEQGQINPGHELKYTILANPDRFYDYCKAWKIFVVEQEIYNVKVLYYNYSPVVKHSNQSIEVFTFVP